MVDVDKCGHMCITHVTCAYAAKATSLNTTPSKRCQHSVNGVSGEPIAVVIKSVDEKLNPVWVNWQLGCIYHKFFSPAHALRRERDRAVSGAVFVGAPTAPAADGAHVSQDWTVCVYTAPPMCVPLPLPCNGGCVVGVHVYISHGSTRHLFTNMQPRFVEPTHRSC
ncbi:hypothetical protein J6590_038244 [Homalodisca vitripennis]|nr:hypothetical protein J6590_038244 [Homalodisca vitripennis]